MRTFIKSAKRQAGVGGRVRLALLAMCLLAAAGCGKKEPEFEGTFAGKVEEKLVEQLDGTTLTKPVNSGTKENVTLAVTKGAQPTVKEVSVGDCKLELAPEHSAASKGDYKTFNEEKKICKLSYGGYTGDFIMSASSSVTKNLKSGNDMVICTIAGSSVEMTNEYPKKSKYVYTYSFTGDRQ